MIHEFLKKFLYWAGYRDGWKKGYELGRSLHDGNCYLKGEQEKVDARFEPMSPKDIGEETIQSANLD